MNGDYMIRYVDGYNILLRFYIYPTAYILEALPELDNQIK